MSRIRLGVNIDHVATLRQARGGFDPDPLEAARIAEDNGADGITVHLREDRRHIQDHDVTALRDVVRGVLNLEMALSDDIISFAKKLVPDQVTLVPEKREELTTEGGLDVRKNITRLKDVVGEFKDLGIIVSLFIEPDIDVIDASKEAGADYIEIHTGTYCNARAEDEVRHELERINRGAVHALAIGLGVNAGHGLNKDNVLPILEVVGLHELNIGHSIISRAVFIGLASAVKEMSEVIGR